jgi:hypothetical protein
MNDAGHSSRTSRLTGDRRGKRAAHDPTLQAGLPSPPRATQRPSALIVGSCQDKVFLADTVLVYAETSDGEEAVRAWLVQHGIRMAPTEKASTSQSTLDSVGRISFGPAKARHDGGNDKC